MNSIVSATVYGLFALYFSYFYCPNQYSSRNLSNLILLPGLIILLITYKRGYDLLGNSACVSLRRIIVCASLVAVLAFLIPPFYSSDIYSYTNGGWQQEHYHVNPYVLMTVGTPGYGTDGMLTSYWALNPFPYGFLFAQIAKIVCQLGSGNLFWTVQLFKVTMTLASVISASVIYVGAKALKIDCPKQSLYLFCFSPLILLHTISNGHNDILMTMFVMSSFLCLWLNLFLYVIPLLMAGILIKYLWIFSLPIVIGFTYQRISFTQFAKSVVVAVILIFCISMPYVPDWQQFQWSEMQKNISVNSNSLAATIEHLKSPIQHLMHINGEPTKLIEQLARYAQQVKIVFIVCFVALWFMIVTRFIKRGFACSSTELIRDCLFLALIAVCLVSGKFYPWYVIMFFPLALWLPRESALRKLVITISCTQLFAVTCIGHDHINNFLLLTMLPFLIFAKSVFAEMTDRSVFKMQWLSTFKKSSS